MKLALKSALIKLTLASFCLTVAAGCSDGNSNGGSSSVSSSLPHVFGGNEVPPDVLNEPRVVTTALPGASAKAAWPLVGNVPSKPNNFTPLPMSDQTMGELEVDRAVAAQKLNQVENPPVTNNPSTVP